MERLTHKIVYDNEHCQYMFDIDQDSEVGTKLGELEDVLEKFEIENPDILALNLQTIKNINIQNANLRNENAELKQKAIVPKFQIGQDVFVILDSVVEETSINSITIFTGNELSYYCKYVGNERMYLELEEEQIFATREEAAQKLAEIKG